MGIRQHHFQWGTARDIIFLQAFFAEKSLLCGNRKTQFLVGQLCGRWGHQVAQSRWLKHWRCKWPLYLPIHRTSPTTVLLHSPQHHCGWESFKVASSRCPVYWQVRPGCDQMSSVTLCRQVCRGQSAELCSKQGVKTGLEKLKALSCVSTKGSSRGCSWSIKV